MVRSWSTIQDLWNQLSRPSNLISHQLSWYLAKPGTPLHNLLKKLGVLGISFVWGMNNQEGTCRWPSCATIILIMLHICLHLLMPHVYLWISETGIWQCLFDKLLWFSEIKIKMCLLPGRCSALSSILLSSALKHAKASYGKLFITTTSTTISFIGVAERGSGVLKDPLGG